MVAKRAALVEDADDWSVDVEVGPASMFTHVVGPHGAAPMGPPAVRPECPVAAELLRDVAM